MTAMMISCLVIGLVGVFVALLSIPFFTHEKTLRKKCTASATGTVVDYVYRGGDHNISVAPKVQFEVNGKLYHAYRHYKGVVSVHKKGGALNPIIEPQMDFHISEKDMFCIHTAGVCRNYRRMGELAWPLGTSLPVVYNPNKPKQAFVEKVVSISNIAGIVLLSTGAGLMLLAGIVFLLTK